MYQSKYCEITGMYERYGNMYVNPGEEIFLYVSDAVVPFVENNRYAISNKLRVFDYKSNRFINQRQDQYITVSLYDKYKCKSVDFPLHRLYMLVFCYIPGCEELEVNHINGNKYNNSPINLEWMTHTENMRHAFENNLINQKLSNFDTMAVITEYNMGIPVRTIAKNFGVSSGYISDIVRGRNGDKKLTLRESIKSFVPVTREKFTPKLDEGKLKEAAERYNNGEDYYILAKEYGIDRSSFTKQIKRYAKTHPEINLRPLKKLTPEMAEKACSIFESNKNMRPKELYDLCLQELGLENNESNRKSIKNLYHKKTYLNISSKFNY